MRDNWDISKLCLDFEDYETIENLKNKPKNIIQNIKEKNYFMCYNSTIEEDGQSCIQEANDNWGSDVVAVEKYLYTHKWVDGRTVTTPQLLDNDLTHWLLVNDDSYRDFDSRTKITRGIFL